MVFVGMGKHVGIKVRQEPKNVVINMVIPKLVIIFIKDKSLLILHMEKGLRPFIFYFYCRSICMSDPFIPEDAKRRQGGRLERLLRFRDCLGLNLHTVAANPQSQTN
jgi:hypothetical protein